LKNKEVNKMPAYDGTGPRGMGPMTGRGMGYCAEYASNPNYFGAGRRIGRGFSRGRGFGQDSVYNPRGLLRPRFMSTEISGGYAENPYHPPTKEEELAALNNDRKKINSQLSGIEKRIKELSK